MPSTTSLPRVMVSGMLVGVAPRNVTSQPSFLASAMAPMVSRRIVPSTTRSQPSDFILAIWALKSEAPRL